MSVPFFYVTAITSVGSTQVLPEDSSRHIVQVLRMTKGEKIRLTDGKGIIAETVITEDHKKKCEVQITGIFTQTPPVAQHVIAISLLKNNTRFEWFLEKATELGVSKIIPLICGRTEKQQFRLERMQSIVISAMLQSQQSWLTELAAPLRFPAFIEQQFNPNDPAAARGFIAHCEAGAKKSLLAEEFRQVNRKVILIGPEGDFTPGEIELAVQQKCEPIELGETRLRTETAGLSAAVLIQLYK